MNRDPKSERQKAHALLDLLPDEKVTAVSILLEAMVEPASQSLTDVPTEDEELTPETAAALERARNSLRKGEEIPHDQVLREYGLKK
ncbi:MAG TPA: hypothetical protein VFO34_14195 [Candidatus Acidoferrales bacterium]|nr:hypothetical protein [Candidatus Acidoferrales bacterium]